MTIILKELLLASALSYLARGFSIIPVGSDKKPLIKWKEFQSRKPTEAEVRQWFDLPNIAGIAIVTGKISNLTVLDVEAGVDVSALEIQRTPTVKTGGGGFHFYFSGSGHDFGNFAGFREKMDIRGEGGYVVAPPSMHPSGNQYAWDISLEDTPIAPMPAWLVDELKKTMNQFELDWQKVEEGVSQGKRNESAAKYVGQLLANTAQEQWEAQVWPELVAWNLKCKPPLSETELRSVHESICQREARKHEPEALIDVSQFKPLSLPEISEILGLTIKHDEENKMVTFLCELTAYTENAQFNISYNAPSSTGKSYIPTEIARLFPKEDVVEIGYCSPTAFFHDNGEFDKEKREYTVDLSRKILIFLDQPHTHLLERLRPLLSHDEKEIRLKITDKTQKFGMKTKNVLLRGYPAVIFCTAGLKIDEQEATRFLLLSPEVNQDKIRQGIHEKIRKEVDGGKYRAWLEENGPRRLLKDRIRAIKQADIQEIKICSEEMVRERFMKRHKMLKPRHQRDITRLLALIKALALLNMWWRERDGSTITATVEDIEAAFNIWGKISVSQELNLPPYIYNFYQEVIVSAWRGKNAQRNEALEGLTGQLGLTRQEILQKHYDVYGRMLDNAQLRQQILPMLETAGLIVQEQDPADKRKILVYPTVLSTISEDQTNSGVEGGVNEDTPF